MTDYIASVNRLKGLHTEQTRVNDDFSGSSIRPLHQRVFVTSFMLRYISINYSSKKKTEIVQVIVLYSSNYSTLYR